MADPFTEEMLRLTAAALDEAEAEYARRLEVIELDVGRARRSWDRDRTFTDLQLNLGNMTAALAGACGRVTAARRMHQDVRVALEHARKLAAANGKARYYLLVEGDSIEPGDEGYEAARNRWLQIAPELVGRAWSATAIRPTRRKEVGRA